MASVNLKDVGGVVKHGGGVLRVIECNDSGTLTGSDYTDLGYIEVTEVYDTTDEEKVFDETGKIIRRNEGNRDVGINVTLMQTNKEVIDFIKGARNKFYTLYYKMSKTGDVNTKTQELFAGICTINPSFKISSGQKKIPVTIQFLPNETAITITAPNTLFGAVATANVSIPANAYYSIVET
jgi:hypothetical protein